MKQNLFEELQFKKAKLIELANKAAEFGWIPTKKSNDASNKEIISLEEIKEKSNDRKAIERIEEKLKAIRKVEERCEFTN